MCQKCYKTKNFCCWFWIGIKRFISYNFWLVGSTYQKGLSWLQFFFAFKFHIDLFINKCTINTNRSWYFCMWDRICRTVRVPTYMLIAFLFFSPNLSLITNKTLITCSVPPENVYVLLVSSIDSVSLGYCTHYQRYYSYEAILTRFSIFHSTNNINQQQPLLEIMNPLSVGVL